GFDAELDWVVIGDKDSPLSREIRLVPLPRGEGRRLAQLQACGDRARFRLRVSGRIRFGQEVERALFFLVAGCRAMPLTPAGVRRVLESENLAERFPWPLNAPRHYWLTRALEQGLAPERFEAFLGHLHEPVPWGPYSLASLERLAEPMRDLGSIILGEAGF